VLENRTPAQSLADLAARTGERHAVVSFARPIERAERAALEASGVKLLGYLGSNSYFASISRDADTAAAAQAAPLTGASAIPTEVKIDPLLADGGLPTWLATRELTADERQNALVPLQVLLYDDADVGAVAADLLAPLGGQLVNQLISVNGMVVLIPASHIGDLASDDRVQWIEAPLRLEPENDSNRTRTQAAQAQTAPYNLNGSGVTVLVFDAGSVRATHQDFGGRVTVLDGAATHYHSTHCAGTIGGSGAASGGTYRGMAPGVDILSAAFEYDGTDIFLYSNPGDIEADWGTAIGMGASIGSVSLGTNTAPNGFPCSLHGQYGLTAAVVDNMIRGSLGDPVIVTWAAGNERGDGSCGTAYWTTAPPSNMKNAIVCGALNSNDDSMTSFSSWGPADDGRLKPDVSGPGCQSNGDGGVTSTGDGSDTEYITLCGTSMATPTIAGCSALLVEDFHTLNGGADPSNALVKAILAHTAVDIGNTGPDYQSGYGSVRIVDAIDHMRTGSYDESTVDQSEVNGYTIDVSPGASELRVTLSWDDPAGTPNVGAALVNDLDLRVVDPNGVQHFPWTLDSSSPATPAVRTKADHLNNLEQVYVSSPMSGTWRVEVGGTNVPDGPQTYAITATPTLVSDSVSVAVSSTVPVAQQPATPLTVDAQVTLKNDTLVPGSVTLHYRLTGGAFSSSAMTDQGGGLYSGEVPGASCGDLIEFYVSGEGQTLGVSTDPAGGAADPYTVQVGQIDTIVDLDFQSSSGGWTVGAAGDSATTGVWERGDPQFTGAQPEDDASPDGTLCWVTQAAAGSGLGTYDIDGGATTLLTNVMDMSALDNPIVSFWVWYSNDSGSAPNEDVFYADISTNGGGSWSNLLTIGPSGEHTQGNWNRYEYNLLDEGVTPTSQVQLRFVASDLLNGSIVEALVDEFSVTSLSCTGPTACSPADLTTQGAGIGDPGYGVPDNQVTAADLNYYVNAYVAGDIGIADVTTQGSGVGDPGYGVPDGMVSAADIQYFVNLYLLGCP